MIVDRKVDVWFSSLPKSDKIYHLIEKSMGDRSTEERIWAIIALGNSGDPRAVGPLIDYCQDQTLDIRIRSIEGLQNLRSGRAVGALIDRLIDKEELPETRYRAAAALAAIKSYSAIQALRNRNEDTDEDEALRSFIGGELEREQLW